MKEYKVSVIVPVYNAENTLPQTLKCLRMQTLQEIEFVLVDDGSADKSLDILQNAAREDPRFVVIHQQNAGVSAARRAGIEAARGAYVGFVDADDQIEADMYELLYNEAVCRQADLVMCDYSEITGETVKERIMGLQPQLICGENASFRAYAACVSAVPSLCNKLYRRALFDGLPELLPLKIGEDMALCTALAPRVRCAAILPQGLYYYVQHPASVMHSRRDLGNEPNQLDQFLRDIAPDPAFDQNGPEWKNLLAARALISLVFTNYSHGQKWPFFYKQLKKLESWPGCRGFYRDAAAGRCLRTLHQAGGLSRSFQAAAQLVFLLCRLHLVRPAARLLAQLRRIIEKRQKS